MDQRRKGTNPVRPSSPRPIHRRIPAAAPTNVVSGQETLVQTLSGPAARGPAARGPSTVGSQRQRPRADQRRKWTRDFGPNPVRPSSPRPIHRRIPAAAIPAAASQSGFPPGTDAGSSAGKPLSLEADQQRKGTRDFGPNP
ncbi:hypothetical protein FQN60_013913, partial [Etheostoma spectabile]